MKRIFLFSSLFWCACADLGYESHSYEPLYLNETKGDVILQWSLLEEKENVSEIKIHPNDTAYCASGNIFPMLLKEGVLGFDDRPISKVRLIFEGPSRKCLFFEGDSVMIQDIRQFSSYENLGPCDFCVVRAMASPDAMLYRINNDLLELAKPCD